ncbi:hypothetical protein P153DRAFT_294269 [Dothidotthia symphoricarpi CBS 119687]|uniref:Tat pathway signal sequence n=1 Tax=Dothidotthia symphoricarpi CBS 119687 TaxID=1392245 RepID=A0A6A6A7R2_9PLEO|nr:uncharacterized protein P153DRAFT_294269 [Dothidotthia symphoricarpi CBS 119687]KAF2128022.1 hypothetical protein P153DRAFT_294269 [Dothidotthia symphoricarpi CBS 119687]
MNVFSFKRAGAHQPLDGERPAKRISTPAGQRLSIVLENSHSKCFQPDSSAKINVNTTTTYCNDPTHQHVDAALHVHPTPRKARLTSFFAGGRLGIPSTDDRSRNGSGSNLSVSVWSDKDGDKFGQVRDRKHGGTRRGYGRKRIIIVAAIVIALIVALAVGLALGLKKKSSDSTSSTSPGSSETSPTPTSGDSQPVSTDTSTTTDSPPTSTSTLSPSTAPENFPVGKYSFITYLDTVNKNCTSDPNTWTCNPITDYYSDPQKALAIMNWEITGSAGAYKLTSRDDGEVLSMTFQNQELELLDEGKDTERYKFQMSRTKSVNMTGTLGDTKGDFECDYGTTTLQGHLYTKLQRDYPDDTISVDDTGYSAWPYAARIEQVAAGGQNIPSCKTTSGEEVTDGVTSQDAGSLCSCLYKNWTPTVKS